MRRSSPLLVAMVALGLLLAACGSSKHTPAASSSNTPKGPPIKLVVVNNQKTGERSLPEVYAGAQAAADAINAAGGVQGRPIVIVHCDSQLDPNASAKCGRDAVADPSVLALAGSYLEFGDALEPVLLAGGLANIGDFPQALPDYTSKVSFPITSGALGTVAGMATLATDVLHATKISVPYVDVPEGAQVSQLLAGVLMTRPGASIVTKVPVPEPAPDLSAYVTAATKNGAQAIVLVLSVDQDLGFLQTAKSLGVSLPLVSPGAEVGPVDIQHAAAATNGTYITTAFPETGGSGNALFTAQMNQYQPGNVLDDLAKNAWLSVRLFAAVAQNVHPLTRAGIINGLNSLTNYTTGGLTPPLNFSTQFSGFGGTFPRLFNPTVIYNKIENGSIIPINGQFANPFAPVGH